MAATDLGGKGLTTTITCYGGVNEIGGNKILLEDGERRLFFDFGKAFGRHSDYFDGVFIKNRTGRGLLDPISLGLIPPLRGLLRDDLVPVLDPDQLATKETPPSGKQKKPRIEVSATQEVVDAFWDRWRTEFRGSYRDLRRAHAAAVDLILLSHAHQDHISDLEFVSSTIAAASTRTTAFISKVLLDTSQESSGAAYVSERRLTKGGLLESAQDSPYIGRPWHFLDGDIAGAPSADPLDSAAAFWAAAPTTKKRLVPADPFAADPKLRLKYWPVDHSLFGAVGLAVETEAGWVAYSGDLRFHGALGEQTWKFAERLAELRPVALLCEGTRLKEPNQTHETDVLANCLQSVRGAEGKLVVADFSPRNVERLQTFVQIAGETDRMLLVQPRDAYLLRALHLADAAMDNLMERQEIGLYDDPKLIPSNWEKLVRERYRSRTFGPLQVRADRGAFILAFSLTDTPDLLDLAFLTGGEGGGAYIFSNSQAYDDEAAVDLVRLWNWTQNLGLELVGLRPEVGGESGRVTRMKVVPGYHASGHAGADELAEFVRRVRPARLIPIHTDLPGRWAELLEGTEIEITLPEYGAPIRLA